jgi:sterol desaturase/sphingolipid hydroxylase (fatty acid hydroxylase superfamily)
MTVMKFMARRFYAPMMLFGFNGAAIFLIGGGAPAFVLGGLLLAAIAVSFLIEQFIPYEAAWNRPHQDRLRDVLHFGVNEASIAAAALTIPLIAAISPFTGLWPSEWPLWQQVLIAILVADFGITLTHWASHRNEMLWRFHAIHHSVKRMYGFNGLMKHPLHQAVELAAGTAPLALAGMPVDVAFLLAFAVAIQLLLQHTNVDVRVGPLKFLLALSPVHRFHHLKTAGEGDVNFGLFTNIWDWFLNTAYFERKRRFASEDLGIGDQPDFPTGYFEQLAHPFRPTSADQDRNPDRKAAA